MKNDRQRRMGRFCRPKNAALAQVMIKLTPLLFWFPVSLGSLADR